MNKCWFSTLNENGNSFVLSCAFTNSETQAKVKTMIKVLVVFIFFQILIYTPNSYFPRNRTWHFPCLAWRKRFSWNNRDTLFRLHDAGMYIQVQSLSNLRFWIAHCLHCICSLLWCCCTRHLLRMWDLFLRSRRGLSPLGTWSLYRFLRFLLVCRKFLSPLVYSIIRIVRIVASDPDHHAE